MLRQRLTEGGAGGFVHDLHTTFRGMKRLNGLKRFYEPDKRFQKVLQKSVFQSASCSLRKHLIISGFSENLFVRR